MEEKKSMEEKKKAQYKRQNTYISAKYDRQTITLKKGVKDRITAAGYSVNGLCNDLINKFLEDNKL